MIRSKRYDTLEATRYRSATLVPSEGEDGLVGGFMLWAGGREVERACRGGRPDGGLQDTLGLRRKLHGTDGEDEVLKATKVGMEQGHLLHLLDGQHAVVRRVHGRLPGTHQDGPLQGHADTESGERSQQQLVWRDHWHQLVQPRGPGLQVLQGVRQLLQGRVHVSGMPRVLETDQVAMTPQLLARSHI